MKNKKTLLMVIGFVAVAITLAIVYTLTTSKNKNLMLTVNKVYLAYSSYLIDMGKSPESIQELYSNTQNVAKWNGPYISKAILDDYSKGSINIVQASSIPTKPCSLDYISYCYKWIKVTNVNSSEYSSIKSEVNSKSEPFFAENNLFFKITSVE